MRLRAFRFLAIGAAVALVSTVFPVAVAQGGNHSEGDGEPGPSAAGEAVDLHRLTTAPGGAGGHVRKIPRRYPVDEAAFGQMKAAANAAARGQAPGGSGETATADGGSGATATASFPTLDITQTGGWQPPDAAVAVGPDKLLVAVNEALAVYSKADGSLLAGPTLFQSFFGTDDTDSIFDPRAFYDAARGRFVLVAAQADAGNKIFYRLAVSITSNPAGPWCRYALSARTGPGGNPEFADFPGLGMDGDRLHITSNQFTFFFPVRFKQSRLLVIPKSSVYRSSAANCGTATSTAFNNLTNPDKTSAFTVQPAHQPDATSGSTASMYFVNAIWASGSRLALRSYNPTTGKLGSASWVNVAPYDLPADAPQLGSAKLIDTGDTRLGAGAVHRLGAIYTSNVTRTVSGLSGANASANIQRYTITPGNSTGQTVAVTDPNVAYYYPAVWPTAGFVALGFMGSGAAQPLSAYGKGSGAAAIHAEGVGGYELDRAGDYSAASGDPSDARKVWVLSHIAKSFTHPHDDGTIEPHAWWATAVGKVTAAGVSP